MGWKGAVILARNWTTKEIQYIKRSALMDETNKVVNISQMASHLERSYKSIEKKISILRRTDDLPKVDNSLQIDSKGRAYTDEETNGIIKMHKQGCPIKSIAERFDRSESAIQCRISKLRMQGRVKGKRQVPWLEADVNWLLENIEFDENGFTSNLDYLAKSLKRQYSSISQKIGKLRKSGDIQVLADKSKTSIKSKKAHQDFNDKRFAHLGRSEGNMVNNIENQKIVESSKVVQVILTIVKDSSGKELHQYFSFEGELLAERGTNDELLR